MESRFERGDVIAERNWIGQTTQFVVLDTVFPTHTYLYSQNGYVATLPKEQEHLYAKIGHIDLKPLREQIKDGGGRMTDKIKSAIEELEFICDCGEIGLTDEEKQTVQLAISSLKAWEEVLEELEKENLYPYYRNNFFDGIDKAIDIINKHLAEIEE